MPLVLYNENNHKTTGTVDIKVTIEQVWEADIIWSK